MAHIRIHGINTARIASAGLGATVFHNYASQTKPFKEKLTHPHYEMMTIRGQQVMSHLSSCPAFYLENAGYKILVDTGLSQTNVQEINKAFEARDIVQHYWKDPGDDLDKGLAALGVRPEEIDLVILSHLHFDHCLNCTAFKNATFLAQADEIPPAITTPPYTAFYYPEFARTIQEIAGRVKAIEGDYKVCPGVEVWKVGGHSPGLMTTVVETKAGLVVIASDLFSCYTSIENRWPTGSLWNLAEAVRSMDRVCGEIGRASCRERV